MKFNIRNLDKQELNAIIDYLRDCISYEGIVSIKVNSLEELIILKENEDE